MKTDAAAVTGDVTAAIKDYAPAHLPVVKAICVECGIVETLNELLEWDEQQCNLSPGHRLMALIMNVLTEGQPMYRLPEFFEGTDIENLFGEGVEPDDLNNHACARALDKLAAAGENTVLGTVFLRVAAHENISRNVLHADTTSFSVQGLYEETDEDDADTLSITHGYSTDNNRHLKQFKAGLGVNRAGVPVIGQILDGNASDKTWNTELIGELREWIDTDQLPVYVADSAAFTQNTLDEATAHGIDLITRIPRRYSAVDDIIDRAWEHDDWTEVGVLSETRDEEDATSYMVQSFEETFHGYDLRCVVVHSSSLDGRTERRVENEIDKIEEELEDAVGRLTDRSFACEPDAQDALSEWCDDHEHPCFEIDAEVFETEEKKSRDGPGRPPKDWDPYKTVYKIAADVQRDAAAITERKDKESCFVVATTLDESDEWCDEDVLTEYKEQQTVERRFPVLKDPKRVGPVYLDRPDRVEALGYVLLLALLVYSVIERRARQALVDADEPMELAGGPTSFRPTGRRVLERFENMRVIRVDGKRAIPDNVDVPDRVLDLVDLSVDVYGVESPV